MSVEILCVPLPSLAQLLRRIQQMPDNGFGAVSKDKLLLMLQETKT